MALESELIEDVAGIAAVADGWEALAVADGRPMSLPGVTTAWLRHLAPAGTRLRIVVVRERGEMIGLAPLFVDAETRGRVDLRLIGASLPRLSPLAAPGREWEVAGAVGRVLARTRPAADGLALESHPLASHWPQALARTWPTKLAPLTRRYLIYPSPVVSMRAGSFDEWLKGKGRRYRSETRRKRRRFVEAGGTVRQSTAETVREDLATLIRLHRARWEGRGRSSVVALESQVRAFYGEIGEGHVHDGRMRITMLELDGAPIAAQISVAAGGEMVALVGGWDPAQAAFSPSLLCLLAALEDGFARGDRRLDLAPGAQRYKVDMADGDDPVAWTLLLLPRARLPLTVARTAPMLARRRATAFAKRALSDEQQTRLRALRRRVG